MRNMKKGKRISTTCGSRNADSDPRPETSAIQMELEISALKTKNSVLTKSYVNLSRQNSDLKNENNYLKKEWVKLHAKLKSTEYAYEKLITDISKCTPSIVEIADFVLKVNKTKGIISGCTPKTKAITQPITPHTVNGTVLMNPTISLTRMSGGGNEFVSEDSAPSTSNDRQDARPFVGEISQSSDDESAEEHQEEGQIVSDTIIQTRRSSLNAPCLWPYKNSPNSAEMSDSDDEADDLNEKQSPEPSNTLDPILEESSMRSSMGEVRVSLRRLSDQDIEREVARNNSRTSIEVSVGDDTYLNMTVMEDQSSIAMGGRLSMVFSPRGNSTRLGTISPFQNNDLTELRVNLTEIQTPKVTPSCTIDESVSRCNSPTPSMSALGDIDKENSKLAILTEELNEKSSVSLPSTSGRNGRTNLSTRQAENRMQNPDSSPLSARSSKVLRQSAINFVCSRRGHCSESSKKVLTPVVVLEKLEYMSTESVSIGGVLLKENDKPKDDPGKSKKRKDSEVGKSTSESRKRTAKLPKLSKTVKSLTNKESAADAPIRSPRPGRAARPTNLKDLSLKCKMRRLV